MFKPFCHKMINNNLRAESNLAISAATFLKWEEVYIFCFLQSETLELGHPSAERFFSRVRLVALSSPSGALLSFAIWAVLGNLSAAVRICFLLLFIPLSILVSSQCLVFLCCLSFPVLFPLPSKLKGLAQKLCLFPLSPSVLPNLGWKLCCTHLPFPSCLDTCSVNVFLFETVYIQKGKKKEKRVLTYVLMVKFSTSVPRKGGIWKPMTTSAWLNEN